MTSFSHSFPEKLLRVWGGLQRKKGMAKRSSYKEVGLPVANAWDRDSWHSLRLLSPRRVKYVVRTKEEFTPRKLCVTCSVRRTSGLEMALRGRVVKTVPSGYNRKLPSNYRRIGKIINGHSWLQLTHFGNGAEMSCLFKGQWLGPSASSLNQVTSFHLHFLRS